MNNPALIESIRRDDESHAMTHCVCCDERLPQERCGGSDVCPECDDCEADVGQPCPRLEAERHAENERKAKLYDWTISCLRNAIADFEEKQAARKKAGDIYFAMPSGASVTDPAAYKTALEAYETASKRVSDEAHRVVGAVDAVLMRGGIK